MGKSAGFTTLLCLWVVGGCGWQPEAGSGTVSPPPVVLAADEAPPIPNEPPAAGSGAQFDNPPQALPQPGLPSPPIDPGFGPPDPLVYPQEYAELEVRGHLQGRVGWVELDQQTTDNYGFHERSGDGAESFEFLDFNIAAEGRGGAGMLMVTVENGFQNQLFQEGSLSVDVTTGAYGSVWVGGCAGPTMDMVAEFELEATGYEMTVEADPEQPGATVVDIVAHFQAVQDVGPSSVHAVVHLPAVD